VAVHEDKRLTASTQPSTRPKPAIAKLRKSHNKPRKRKRRERFPPSLRYTETKRGKTTVRRYDSRSVHRLEEVQGKLVDRIEIHDSGGDHAISVRFQDKTSISFSIEPGFILFTEYADWKTGNWRPIKRWPPLRSQGLRVP
jgi:hypothetical protein